LKCCRLTKLNAVVFPLLSSEVSFSDAMVDVSETAGILLLSENLPKYWMVLLLIEEQWTE
jgi:hypothetical protein